MKNTVAESATKESLILSIIVDMGQLVLENDARVKHILDEADKLLQDALPVSDREAVLERLTLILSGLDKELNHPSVAIFIGKDFEKVVPLNYKAAERIILGESCASCETAFSDASCSSFNVIVFGGNHIRLFEAAGEHIFEIKENDSLVHMRHLLKSQDSSDTPHEQKIQTAFAELCKILEHPIVLIGTSHFDEPATNIIGSIPGSYDHATQVEILKLATDQLNVLKAAKAEKTVDELDQLLHEKRLGSGVDEITELIKAGRVEKLFLIERISAASDILTDNKLTQDDRLISLALEFGGEIAFLPESCLTKFEGMAAALRY